MPEAGCGAAGSWLAAVGALLSGAFMSFVLGAGVGVVSGAVVFGVTAFGAAVPGAAGWSGMAVPVLFWTGALGGIVDAPPVPP